MIRTGCMEEPAGAIPKEYAILPIGFMAFKMESPGVIVLTGWNSKAEDILHLSSQYHLGADLQLLKFEEVFYQTLAEVFKDKESREFVLPIEATDLVFECSLVFLDEDCVGCFFQKKIVERSDDLALLSNQGASIYQQQRSFKHLFHTFFHYVPVGIVLIDPEGIIEDVNNYFTKLFGYTYEEITKQDIDEYIVPEYLREEGLNLTSKALNREVINYQTVRKRKDGKEVHVLIQAAPIMQDQHQMGIFLIYQDVTSQQEALEKVKETGRKLEELHKVVHQLDACQEEHEVFQVTVEAAANILKLDSSVIVTEDKERLVPRVVAGRLSLNDFPVVKTDFGIVGKTYTSGETYYCGDITRVSGANHFRDDCRSVLTVPIGKLGVLQAISTDIDAYTQDDVRLTELLAGHTEEVIKRICLKEQLYYQANYDALTGLINRHYFNQLLDREVARAKQYNYGITFLMIDVDNFKKINDTLGHLAGDKVLRDVAKLILENVRECDYVVRYGGDEFIIIMTEVNIAQKQEKVQKVIDSIRASVKEWCAVQEAFLRSLSISIGASHWSPDGDKSIKEVLREADVWMYSDKKITNQ